MTYPVPYESPRQKFWGNVLGIGMWAAIIGGTIFAYIWNRAPASEEAADPTPRVEGYTTVAAEHGIYLLVPEEIQLSEPEEPDYRP